jgi:hypothetical protein
MREAMAGRDDLYEIEKNFWTGDAQYYRQNLAEKCMVVFTEMAGLKNREEVAAMITDPQRWQDLKLKDRNVVELADGAVLLSYRASAKRANGQPYEALVSSAYVKENGRWKMAFHQQTPIAAS